MLSVTDPLGTITSYAFDALNRQVTQVADFGTALAATTMLAYDGMDNVTASTDAGGFITSLAYDHLYRQTTLTDPGGGVTTTAYDHGNDVLAVTDANGQTTSYGYDALQRTTTVTNPLLAGQTHPGVTTMAYDANDNMVSLTDPDGNTTTFQFDALNRQTKRTDPLNASATFAYDAADRLTSQTDRDGRVKLYTYDGLDRELTETWKSGATTVNVLTFAYDPGDNITAAADYHGSYTMGYDTLARLTAEQEPFNLALTFAYDANDNRTLVQDSFGGVLTSVYDGLDRLTSRQFGGTGQTPLRFDLGYNSRNDLVTVNRYSDLAGTVTVGYSSYSYDAVDRVTAIQHQNGSGSVLANFTYSYDLGSRVTSEDANGSTRTFQYDKANELTSDGLNSYSYDLNGNRTMTGYTTGTGNELTGDGTWTYAYDGEGNTISKRNTSTGELWSFGYDLDNRIVTAKDVSGAGATLTLATYTYDVFGNRIEKDVWTQSSGTTTVTRFGYDGDQVWADLAGDNSLQMRYLRGDEADQLFARISGAGVAAWYLTDWEGSVRKLTDGSGTLQDTITYDGFGDVTAETNATAGGAYKFDGMRYDAETGDYHTWGRTEAPGVGRWLQQDPLGVSDADFNSYSAYSDDPANLADPLGLQVVPFHLDAKLVAHPPVLLGKRGAFAWPIEWILNRKSNANGGMILQHVQIWYHVTRKGMTDPIPYLPWGDNDTLMGQNPSSELGRGRGHSYPNVAPNIDYWEAWRVSPEAKQAMGFGKLTTDPGPAFVRTIVKAMDTDGVNVTGIGAHDWFAMTSVRHPGGPDKGEPRDDTCGWIIFKGKAWYFSNMTFASITGTRAKPFFRKQPHLTTLAGLLWSYPTGISEHQKIIDDFVNGWKDYRSNEVDRELKVHWDAGGPTILDYAKVNNVAIDNKE